MKLFGRPKKKYRVDREQLKVLKKELDSLDDEETVEPPEEYDEPQPEEPENKERGKKHEAQIMGKYLLRDMPLFRYEIMLYFMLGVAAVMLYMVDRIGLIDNATRIIVLPAVILPIGIWFVKWLVYMPRGKRVPGMKLYRSGIVEMCVFDVSKRFIPFGRGENMKRKWITKINKHIEASTGRPFVVVSELSGENINLLKESKPDMKSEEFNAILETERQVVTKNVMNRMMQFTKPGLTNPMMILGIIQLILLVVVLVKTMGFLGA